MHIPNSQAALIGLIQHAARLLRTEFGLSVEVLIAETDVDRQFLTMLHKQIEAYEAVNCTIVEIRETLDNTKQEV